MEYQYIDEDKKNLAVPTQSAQMITDINNPTNINNPTVISNPTVDGNQLATPNTTIPSELVKYNSPVQNYNNENYPKVYDSTGNVLSRSSIEQMENMSLAKDLARIAARPDTRSSYQEVVGYTPDQIIKGKHGSTSILSGQPIYETIKPSGDSQAQSAMKALAAFIPVVGTIPSYAKELAQAENLDKNTNLAGDKANAENKRELAYADYLNSKSKEINTEIANDKKWMDKKDRESSSLASPGSGEVVMSTDTTVPKTHFRFLQNPAIPPQQDPGLLPPMTQQSSLSKPARKNTAYEEANSSPIQLPGFSNQYTPTLSRPFIPRVIR